MAFDSPQQGTVVDPKAQGAKPEFPPQTSPPPGFERDLRPTADHGEASYKGLGRLQNRVALITGGDSGIGRAVARRMAGSGMTVIVADYEHAAAEQVRAEIEEAGGTAAALSLDDAARAAEANVIRAALDETGGHRIRAAERLGISERTLRYRLAEMRAVAA